MPAAEVRVTIKPEGTLSSHELPHNPFRFSFLWKTHYLLQFLGRRCILVCDWQSRKRYEYAKEKSEFFLLFPPPSSTSLLMLLPIFCNSLFIIDTVTGIYLENLTKLSPSYAFHYTGDHVFALALPRDLEETVHKHITIKLLRIKTPKKNLTKTSNKTPATHSHPKSNL